MKELSRIASAVQASTTMAIDAMFKQMKADGVDVIGFGAGEPDFNTPDNIKAAGIAAIEQNVTRYYPRSRHGGAASGGVRPHEGRLRTGVQAQPSGGEQRRQAPGLPGVCGQWSTPVTRSFCRRPTG